MKSNVRRQISRPNQDNTQFPREAQDPQRPSPVAGIATPILQGDTVGQASANDPYAERRRACTLLPISEVIRRVSLQRTSIYELIKSGNFPAPVKAGAASRWVDREIDVWIETLMQQRNPAPRQGRE